MYLNFDNLKFIIHILSYKNKIIKLKKNITFAIGSGRCGTTFLHKLFNKHNDIASCHERYPNLEKFFRY